MFWNIVIGLASWALQLVLTPKPVDAKAAKFDEMSVPTAEEGIEIPVLFGTRPLKAPNVVWHGHRKVAAIKGARRYGLFGPKQTIGHKYYLGMHMGLCHSAIDAIFKIRVGEKVAWQGTNRGGRLTISKPNLFGGQDREGGISGDVDIELGLPDQVPNDYLVSALGADNVPGHRGITGAVLRRVYLGTTPYIKPWEFTAQRIYLRSDGSAQWYSDKAGIGDGDKFTTEVNQQITGPFGTAQIDFATDLSGGYIANLAAGNLSVWKYPNVSTPLWTKTDLPSDPQAVSLDGRGNLFVAHRGAGLVTVLNVATGAVKSTVDIGGGFSNAGINTIVVGETTYVFQWKGARLSLARGTGVLFTSLGDVDVAYGWISSTKAFALSPSRVYALKGGSSFNEKKVLIIPWSPVGLGVPQEVVLTELFGDAVSISYIADQDIVVVLDRAGGIHAYDPTLSTRLRYRKDSWSLALDSHLRSNRMSAGNGRLVFRATQGALGNVIVEYAASNLSLLSLVDASDIPYFAHDNSAYSHSGVDPDTSLMVVSGISGVAPLAGWSLPKRGVEDMNPAHIIRECLTDRAWGMGDNESDIDDVSFTAAADTFFNEGFGISPLWAREAEIEEFIRMVQAHVDAYVYTSRTTGKWVIKPIRADYDVDTIPVIDEDDVIIWNEIVRRPTNEAVNAVIVKFFDRSTGKDASHTVVNVAAVQQAGKVISVTRDYPAICSRSLAQRVGERDLRSLGSGMISGRITCKRTVEKLNPGDPFRLVSSSHELSGEVMRVADMKVGDGRSNAITIQLAQDVFSLADEPVFSDGEFNPPDETETPLPPSQRLVWEMPYREARQMVGDSDLAAMLASDPDAGLLQASAVRPATGASINAEMQVDDGTGYAFADMLEFAPGGMLAADVAVTGTTMTLAAGADLDDATAGMLATIKGATAGEDEVVRIDGISGNVLTIARGCLDTVPRAHAAGASVVVFDDFSMTDSEIYTSTDSVNVKLLTVGDGGVLELADAPADAVTFASRAIRPLRPADVQVNGAALGPVDATAGSVSVTFVERNRLTESTALAWTDAAQTPEDGQTAVVDLYDDDTNTLLQTYSGVTSPFMVPPVDYASYFTVRVKVLAERAGYRSHQGYEIAVAVRHPEPPDLTYALLLTSIDELDPPAGLLLSGDEQTSGGDIIELSGDER